MGVIFKLISNSGFETDLVDVVYVKDKFFAVGDLGTILSSKDGIKWEVIQSGTEIDLKGVAVK